MRWVAISLIVGGFCGCSSALGPDDKLPKTLTSRIPLGYHVASYRSSDFNGDGSKDFVLIAVSHLEKEESSLSSDEPPKRLVMVYFAKRSGNDVGFELVAQNESVALPANGGGASAPCDPLFDEGDGLAVKDVYFTVENQVACGAHWTDFITFKYSPNVNAMVFYSRISETSGLIDKTGEFGVIHRNVEKAGAKVLLLQDYRAF
jgi:hypothetical protein